MNQDVRTSPDVNDCALSRNTVITLVGPDRSPGQSVDEYWSTPATVASIMTVWFLLEGAGTIAAVGYFFSEPATGAAIVAFWLCGPNVFAKA